jgi:DNA invertase Pin-like site-specific DNA recombinase
LRLPVKPPRKIIIRQNARRLKQMRVALYARFSRELQDPRSIEDQLRAPREYAARQGWQVVAEYEDRAASGASMHNRPGLRDLIVAAEARQFDVVLTESLDRLSRDLADIAGLHKRLDSQA